MIGNLSQSIGSITQENMMRAIINGNEVKAQVSFLQEEDGLVHAFLIFNGLQRSPFNGDSYAATRHVRALPRHVNDRHSREGCYPSVCWKRIAGSGTTLPEAIKS